MCLRRRVLVKGHEISFFQGTFDPFFVSPLFRAQRLPWLGFGCQVFFFRLSSPQSSLFFHAVGLPKNPPPPQMHVLVKKFSHSVLLPFFFLMVLTLVPIFPCGACLALVESCEAFYLCFLRWLFSLRMATVISIFPFSWAASLFFRFWNLFFWR